MQMDRLRIGRAGAVALAAVALFAGLSSDAKAYGGAGEIRLQLGGFNPANRWIYTAPDGTSLVETISVATGKTAIAKKCQYSTDGTATRNVADLKAIVGGGTGNPDNQSATSTTPIIGLGVDSIGVYDNSIGVSCYRMSESLVEGLRFEFGSSIPIPSRYYDRLELDMEVKGDAAFDLTVERTVGDSTTYVTYHLRSGGSIDPAVGSAGESFPGTLSSQTFNCLPASDSGPDSAGNDNCRWIINDVGSSFELRVVNNNVASSDGAGSLEGGGDFGSAASALQNNTIIYLASLSDTGSLTCCQGTTCPDVDFDTVGDDNLTATIGGGSTATCQVTRIATVEGGLNVCDKPFPYNLTTSLSESACDLTLQERPVAPQQMAASVVIQHHPTDRTNIGVNEPRTVVRFDYPCTVDGVAGICRTSDSLDSPPPFVPERCEGTVVTDANGKKTIGEVLQTPQPLWVTDVVNSDHYPDADWPSQVLEFACILSSTITYIGADLQQRTDTVLFWGDAKFSFD